MGESLKARLCVEGRDTKQLRGAGGILNLFFAFRGCAAERISAECVGQHGSCYLCEPVAALFVSFGGKLTEQETGWF